MNRIDCPMTQCQVLRKKIRPSREIYDSDLYNIFPYVSVISYRSIGMLSSSLPVRPVQCQWRIGRVSNVTLCPQVRDISLMFTNFR